MKKIFIILVFIMGLYQVSHSQSTAGTTASKDYGTFGVGISFQPFSFASLLDEAAMVPVGGINFAYNVSGRFRLEADLGYMSMDNKYEKEKTSALNTGIGLLATFRKESTAIMAGIKVDYTTGSNEYRINGPSAATYTNKITALAFGPVLAYEHQFGKQFSIGGELGFKIRNYKETADEDLNLQDDEYKVNSTFVHNALYVRVYF